MNIQLFKSWIPYILIYILIFNDPYKYIIPVNEPELIYSLETTWLLDESTKNSDFATVYNKKFEDKIYGKDNAYPYFKNAFSDQEYSNSTKDILNKLDSQGDNREVLEIVKSEKLNTNIIGFYNDLIPIEKILDDSDFKRNKAKALAIIDKINLPSNINHLDIPCFASYNDSNILYRKSIQYTFYLIFYAEDLEKSIKALKQCRLLANQSNPQQLLCSVLVYNTIIKKNDLNYEQLKKIEKDFPEWPNLNNLITQLYRSQIITSTIEDPQKLKEELQSYDLDLFLDKSIFLKRISTVCREIAEINYDMPINNLSIDKKAKISNFLIDFKTEKDKRFLAERVLFSSSIKEQHNRISIINANETLNYYFLFIFHAIKHVEKDISVFQENKEE